jgi:hypothetical protein
MVNVTVCSKSEFLIELTHFQTKEKSHFSGYDPGVSVDICSCFS